jgi:hypothetical protein
MKIDKFIPAYSTLRTQPLWRLLAADNAPIIIGLLQVHLLENERSLPASIFFERIQKDLEELRGRGENLPQTAQAYIADWLGKGYLERRFAQGAIEEEYEISSAAATAIRFVMGLREPRTVATESRLATVIHQVMKLSEDTDPNPKTRITALLAERARIDQEIKATKEGKISVIADNTALERAREIIALSDELVGDFNHVRDRFEDLNRDLRFELMNNEGNRGDVLNSLFGGVDLITESEAGRTFSAFWRLLTDPEQSALLEESVEKIMKRRFAKNLARREYTFLLNLTSSLLEQSGSVHTVLQYFARSLKNFVQSKEYLEQRRLNFLFKEAQSAAVALKENPQACNGLNYILMLTSSRVRSISQWRLEDPTLRVLTVGMQTEETLEMDMNVISRLISESEIDFNALKKNIRIVLQGVGKTSIANVLKHFPAAQGLGSIVGYIALGSRHGVSLNKHEMVSWVDRNNYSHRAKISIMYFLREKIHELY